MIYGESIYFCKVSHQRFFPKKYSFNFYFYWFLLPLISKNDQRFFNRKYWRFFLRLKNALFSFSERDHYKHAGLNLEESLKSFLEKNMVMSHRKVDQIYILTNPRSFGYVFNPITFYFVILSDKTILSLVQICNTFNELKLYMGSEIGYDNQFRFQTKKEFYVSPFISLDSVLNFNFSIPLDKFQVIITDFSHDNQLLLKTYLTALRKKKNFLNTLFMAFHIPLQNFLIITFIHFHAFTLWMKGMKYYKKNENIDMQQGFQKWKD